MYGLFTVIHVATNRTEAPTIIFDLVGEDGAIRSVEMSSNAQG